MRDIHGMILLDEPAEAPTTQVAAVTDHEPTTLLKTIRAFTRPEGLGSSTARSAVSYSAI